MRKKDILFIIALTAAVLASLAWSPVGTASAQEVPPVGVVIEYIPGQSITIMDQSGVEHEYTISSAVKILPPNRASALAIGSFVTIIAPASFDNGKQTAVGIVVHPGIPNGWNMPSGSATPLATNTAPAVASATVTTTAAATGTPPPPETATATLTATGTALATDTPPATATATATGVMDTATPTPAATATPLGGGAAVPPNTFFEWLRSLFRQVVTGE